MFLKGFRNHCLWHVLKSFFSFKLIFQRPKYSIIFILNCTSLYVSLMARIKPEEFRLVCLHSEKVIKGYWRGWEDCFQEYKVLWKCKPFAALLVLLLSRTANKLVSNTLFTGLFTTENSAGVETRDLLSWSYFALRKSRILHYTRLKTTQ